MNDIHSTKVHHFLFNARRRQYNYAQKIVLGQTKIHTGIIFEQEKKLYRPSDKLIMDEKQELWFWQKLKELCDKDLNKIHFNKKKMATVVEKRRRFAIFLLFHLINFRSQNEEIKKLFQQIFGQISMRSFCKACDIQAPPWYYIWAFETLPLPCRLFGPYTIFAFKQSPPHMEVFNQLQKEKEKLLKIKRVIEM